MTEIEYTCQIDDQEIPVTLVFSVEATGNPNAGFFIKSAVLTEYAIWLHKKQAEEPCSVFAEKVNWFLDHVYSTRQRDFVDAKLTEQWQADRELDAETKADREIDEMK